MTTLVVGATGATGKHLVKHLLDQNQTVKAVVRNRQSVPPELAPHPNLTLIEASLLDLTDAELQTLVADCTAIASCLGHNLTFKGLYGHPRRLVTDATRRLCQAIKANQPAQPVKFILMNTSGNNIPDLNEKISLAEKLAIRLIRIILPPHIDNEMAADYLRTTIGHNDPTIKWIAVRPSGLINSHKTSKYETYPSPIRSAIFNDGCISRINVGHFMAELITQPDLWQKWNGKLPVIYNTDSLT
ncbi:MAG TPA: NAD(P)-binding oxidoreductase [Anaerolineae bacterium]|nr:NAD(P)-binding oxidoreductase [Anaerolineae bacterium]